MAIDFIPKNPLERAIRERDRALVVRFVADGYRLGRTAPAGWLDAFPEAVAMLVLKLALPRRLLEALDTPRCRIRGDVPREILKRALSPYPERPNAAEKRLVDAVVRADGNAVMELVRKTPGTLRDFSPELLIMLPELTREATVAFFASGFAPTAVPKLFSFLLHEAEEPDVLASMSYRKRLMYANLLIHLLQGETVRADEDWYPMGASVANGDRSVYCHTYDYCYDPRHRYEPRRDDDEYEKPARDVRKS